MLGKGIETDSDALQVILTSDVFKRLYPNILLLIVIKLVLWLRTAECERGFSLRTLLKTKQRASMGNSLLDILMMICCNGPAIDDKLLCLRLLGLQCSDLRRLVTAFPAGLVLVCLAGRKKGGQHWVRLWGGLQQCSMTFRRRTLII